jgi:hypothetical protein
MRKALSWGGGGVGGGGMGGGGLLGDQDILTYFPAHFLYTFSMKAKINKDTHVIQSLLPYKLNRLLPLVNNIHLLTRSLREMAVKLYSLGTDRFNT